MTALAVAIDPPTSDPTPDTAAPVPPHLPVMVERVTELLSSAPEGLFVDATIGAGGHARALADVRSPIDLLGVDRDPAALMLARAALAGVAGTITFAAARFDHLIEIVADLDARPVAGILFDLGMSSMQVDQVERGFSYRQQAPLDMRMDPQSPRTAGDIVNSASEDDLARIFREFGEERFSKRIAAAIAAARPLATTTDLADVVRDAVPHAARRSGRHPAVRVFQALRIEVNGELDAFSAVLPPALELLAPGGVCVVLAYHSLEDRIAKRTFADAARGCICPPDLPVCACGRTPGFELLTRGVERAGQDEVHRNPRASSAKLRAIRRLPQNADSRP